MNYEAVKVIIMASGRDYFQPASTLCRKVRMFRCSVMYTHLADTLKLTIANHLTTHLRYSQQTNPQHRHGVISCKQFT